MAKIVKIEDLLGRSAKRFLSEEQLAADPALVAKGWERRFTADAQRTAEAVELYERLGYEVRTEPVRAEEAGQDCEDCSSLMVVEFKTIYTRKKAK
jgi:hypothetical protein